MMDTFSRIHDKHHILFACLCAPSPISQTRVRPAPLMIVRKRWKSADTSPAYDASALAVSFPTFNVRSRSYSIGLPLPSAHAPTQLGFSLVDAFPLVTLSGQLSWRTVETTGQCYTPTIVPFVFKKSSDLQPTESQRRRTSYNSPHSSLGVSSSGESSTTSPSDAHVQEDGGNRSGGGRQLSKNNIIVSSCRILVRHT